MAQRLHLGRGAGAGFSHSAEVVCAAFAPWKAGAFIVSASNDRTAIVWSQTTQTSGWISLAQLGEKDNTFCAAHAGQKDYPRSSHCSKVTSVAFSPRSTKTHLRIATSSDDGTAIVWDVKRASVDGEWEGVVAFADLRPSGKVGGPKLRCVAWSHDEAFLLTTAWKESNDEGNTNSNCVQVWRQLDSPLPEDDPAAKYSRHFRKCAALRHRGWVWSAEFAPDDAATIVSASSDKRAIVWRSATGISSTGKQDLRELWKEVAVCETTVSSASSSSAPVAAPAAAAPAVQPTADSSIARMRIAAGDPAPMQTIYNGDTGKWEVQSCEDRTWKLALLSCSGSGSGSESSTTVSSAAGASGASPRASAWCAKYTRTTNQKGWERSDDKSWVRQSPLHMYGELSGVTGHSEWVVSVKLSPRWVVSDERRSNDRYISKHGPPTKVHAAGAFIATASYDKTAILWSMATLQPIATFRGHTDRVWSAAFAHNRPLVVTASADKTVRVWHIGSKACVASLAYDSSVYSARFSTGPSSGAKCHSADSLLAVALKGDGEQSPAEVAVQDLHKDERILCLRSHVATTTASVVEKSTCINHCDYSRNGGADKRRLFVTAGSGGLLRIINAVKLVSRDEPVSSSSGSSASSSSARSTSTHTSSPRSPSTDSAIVDDASDKTYDITIAEDSFWSPKDGEGHDEAIYCCAFSPDGRRLVTASKENAETGSAKVIVWEWKHDGDDANNSWDNVGEINSDHLRGVSVESCLFDPHSTLEMSDGDEYLPFYKLVIASGSCKTQKSGACMIWEQQAGTRDWKRERELPLLNTRTCPAAGDWTHEHAAAQDDENENIKVTWAEFSPVLTKRRLIATCSTTHHTIKKNSDVPPCVVWDVSDVSVAAGEAEPITTIVAILEGRGCGAYNIRWSPDGTMLATANALGHVSVYDVGRDFTQRYSIEVSTTRLFSLAWSHDSARIATGGLDKRAFIVGVEAAEVEATLVGAPGIITSVSFSRSSATLAVTTALGHVLFCPVTPFSTQGIVDVLRSKTGLINPSARYIESLNWLNTSSPWQHHEASAAGTVGGQHGGSTALHLLADSRSGNTFGDEANTTSGEERQRHEAVVKAWAHSDAPYFPVCNEGGATPLEVAIVAKNHLFTLYLFDSRKGNKGVMWNTDPMWKHAQSYRPDLVTVRDLSKLLEWPSAVQYAVRYISQEKLLVAAPPVAIKECETYYFRRQFHDVFEVTGARFGAACRRGLWADFVEEGKKSFRRRCERAICVESWLFNATMRKVLSPAEAHYIAMEGLAGPAHGRNALWQLVFGGTATLPAFSGPAMRYLVAFKWNEIGYLFYVTRLALYSIFVVIQTALSVSVSYESEREDSAGDVSQRRALCIAIIAFCVFWTADELVQISVAGRFAYRCSFLRGDAKDGRYSGRIGEVQKTRCGRLCLSQPCCPAHPDWYWCTAPTFCIAMGHDFGVMVHALQLWVGVFNVIDALSIAASASAAVLDLTILHTTRGDDTLNGVAQALMAAAGLLTWLRFFEQVRGSTYIGFYSRLIKTSVLDILPFVVLLGIVLIAFATAMAPLAPQSSEGVGEMNDKGYGVWGSTMGSAAAGKLLQLLHLNIFGMVEQFDVQGGLVATVALTPSAQIAQLLVYVFILLVPVVMLKYVCTTTRLHFPLVFLAYTHTHTHTHTHTPLLFFTACLYRSSATRLMR